LRFTLKAARIEALSDFVLRKVLGGQTHERAPFPPYRIPPPHASGPSALPHVLVGCALWNPICTEHVFYMYLQIDLTQDHTYARNDRVPAPIKFLRPSSRARGQRQGEVSAGVFSSGLSPQTAIGVTPPSALGPLGVLAIAKFWGRFLLQSGTLGARGPARGHVTLVQAQ
jgi:hypothetical protein